MLRKHQADFAKTIGRIMNGDPIDTIYQGEKK